MNSFRLFVFFVVVLWQGAVLAASAGDENTGSSDVTEQLVRMGVSSSELLQLKTALQQAGFTEESIKRIYERMHDAVSDGAPSGALLAKINEGVAKGASAEQISRVMTVMRERYVRSELYLQELGIRETERAEIMLLLVNVQTAGMAAGDLERIISRLSRADGGNSDHKEEMQIIRESLLLTQELRRLGVDSTLVADMATGLLAKNADSNDFSDITASFRRMNDRNLVAEQTRLCLANMASGADIGQLRESLQVRVNRQAEKRVGSEPGTGAGQGNQQGQDNGNGHQNGGNTGNGAKRGG